MSTPIVPSRQFSKQVTMCYPVLVLNLGSFFEYKDLLKICRAVAYLNLSYVTFCTQRVLLVSKLDEQPQRCLLRCVGLCN